MQNDPIIEQAIRYAEELFRGNSDGHGFEHTMRVYRTAMRIADTEPVCNRQTVALAALLHDTDDPKLFRTENNANARAFLADLHTDYKTTEAVCAVINAVSFSKNRGKVPETLEGKIVQDADRLDAIGAIGVARTFAYGGKHGRPPEESIAHFHEKLLLLREMMNTAKAKEIAEGRHVFMEQFLQEWEKENDC